MIIDVTVVVSYIGTHLYCIQLVIVTHGGKICLYFMCVIILRSLSVVLIIILNYVIVVSTVANYSQL